MVSFPPYFPSLNKVGRALDNGVEVKLIVSDFYICREDDCFIRDKNDVLVAKPKQAVRIDGMSDCEVCFCGAYGIVSCKCQLLCQQAVSCESGKILVLGDDCCVRCPPVAASCESVGDPHFVSFDGLPFSYQGIDTFLMAKTKDFEIRIKT